MRNDHDCSTGRGRALDHGSEEPTAHLSILSADRGISDVVGYVLVVSLVLSIVGIVTVAGFNSLDEAREVEQTNNAERAFDVLADNTADVYEHGAPSRATEISLTGATIQTSSSVTLNISGEDTSSNDNFTFELSGTPIVWQGNRKTELAYSFGATIRDERNGGVVVGEPPFRIGTERTVIQVVQLRNQRDQAFSEGTIRVRATRGSSSVLVTENPNTYDEVWLNMTTPRASIWEQYLDQYPDTACAVETKAAGEAVVCELTNRDELHVTLTRITVDLEG